MRKKPKNYRYLLILLLVINLTFVAAITSFNPPNNTSTPLPELSQIEGQDLNFDQLSKFFKELSAKKGAEYAFEVLKVAKFAPNIDMHLMGHIVGDELYKQQGMDGIRLCTEDFRNACSHSIAVGLLMDKGESALPEITTACAKAPGGKGAYTMCYHGLGHGVLAYSGYDLPKTIELCQQTATTKYQGQEFPQCVGGAVMEIISGGGHDKSLWANQRLKYLDPKNPLYICSKDFMPESARTFCYTYITPYLWEAVGADMGAPKEADFAKAFPLCDSIEELNHRKTCYGSFGKDFLGLALERDIRNTSEVTDTQLTKIINWCQLTNSDVGTSECLLSALSSLYWGGEKSPKTSIRFCTLQENQQTDSCFETLTNLVQFYIDDKNYFADFCQSLPANYQQMCQNRLITKI